MQKIDILVKFEEPRAHWWLIYCKCRQIEKKMEDKTVENKKKLVEELSTLQSPCCLAKQITKELLWNYLMKCQDGIDTPNEIKGKRKGVKITSTWLWGFFGYKLVDTEVFSSYLSTSKNNKRYTPQEKLEFYHRTSVFFLQLLKEIIAEGKKENQDIFRLEELEGITYIQFARSLIYLISEYFHLHVDMSRVFDVEAVLQKTIFSDAYLYLTKERYRDHMFHVIDVCLMGFFLLQCKLQGGKTLLSIISHTINKNPLINSNNINIINNVFQNWFLAALFHDIGYCLQAEDKNKAEYQEKKGTKALGEMEWQNIMVIEKLKIHRRNLVELETRKAHYGINFPLYILNQIEAEKEEIRQLEINLGTLGKSNISIRLEKEFTSENIKKTSEATDHGVRSYEYVKEVLRSLPEDNELLLKKYKPALEAIRKHNLMTEEINFEKEPLSFLLVLCDELQEWGRARVDIMELREAVVSNIIFPDTNIFPTNSLLEYLYVNVELSKNHYGKLLGKSLDFSLIYKDSTSENFEPLAIWLLKAYNFQRLIINKKKLQINVTLRNPVCNSLLRNDTPGLCEFNLLRDFMRDQRKWRQLQEWFKNDNQIKWETKEELEENPESNKKRKKSIEYITMYLNQLSKKRLLHEDPSDFFEELFQWRHEYIDGKRKKL